MSLPFTFAELATYWLIAINFLAFAAFGFDKAQAEKGSWRVREKTLIGYAFWGGLAGAYAGRALFRHKTRKGSFSGQLHGVAALHLVVFGVGGGAWLFPEQAKAVAVRVSGNPALFMDREEIKRVEMSVTYTGCDEVRLRGLDPLHAGQPGYRVTMDGDGDGLACEPYY